MTQDDRVVVRVDDPSGGADRLHDLVHVVPSGRVPWGEVSCRAAGLSAGAALEPERASSVFLTVGPACTSDRPRARRAREQRGLIIVPGQRDVRGRRFMGVEGAAAEPRRGRALGPAARPVARRSAACRQPGRPTRSGVQVLRRTCGGCRRWRTGRASRGAGPAGPRDPPRPATRPRRRAGRGAMVAERLHHGQQVASAKVFFLKTSHSASRRTCSGARPSPAAPCGRYWDRTSDLFGVNARPTSCRGALRAVAAGDGAGPWWSLPPFANARGAILMPRNHRASVPQRGGPWRRSRPPDAGTWNAPTPGTTASTGYNAATNDATSWSRRSSQYAA